MEVVTTACNKCIVCVIKRRILDKHSNHFQRLTTLRYTNVTLSQIVSQAMKCAKGRAQTWSPTYFHNWMKLHFHLSYDKSSYEQSQMQ